MEFNSPHFPMAFPSFIVTSIVFWTKQKKRKTNKMYFRSFWIHERLICDWTTMVVHHQLVLLTTQQFQTWEENKKKKKGKYIYRIDNCHWQKLTCIFILEEELTLPSLSVHENSNNHNNEFRQEFKCIRSYKFECKVMVNHVLALFL